MPGLPGSQESVVVWSRRVPCRSRRTSRLRSHVTGDDENLAGFTVEILRCMVELRVKRFHDILDLYRHSSFTKDDNASETAAAGAPL